MKLVQTPALLATSVDEREAINHFHIPHSSEERHERKASNLGFKTLGYPLRCNFEVYALRYRGQFNSRHTPSQVRQSWHIIRKSEKDTTRRPCLSTEAHLCR